MADATYDALEPHVAFVLRHVWNPIGLGADGPTDEYDEYVPDVVALMQGKTASETVIAAHLMRIEAERMRLSPVPANATRAARALLGLPKAYADASGAADR